MSIAEIIRLFNATVLSHILRADSSEQFSALRCGEKILFCTQPKLPKKELYV